MHLKKELTGGCQDGDSGQDRIESHVPDTELRCSEVMIRPAFIGPLPVHTDEGHNETKEGQKGTKARRVSCRENMCKPLQDIKDVPNKGQDADTVRTPVRLLSAYNCKQYIIKLK